MPEREQPPYLPPLPERERRPPDLVPATSPEEPPVIAAGEAEAPFTAPPAVDAGDQRSALTREPAPAAVETPSAIEQERVVLTGRVGRDPRFWVTRGGVARAVFPLGSKDDPEGERTTWRDIHWWAGRAENVRDTVRRGQLVDVIAYRRVTDGTGARGPRRVEEFRGSVIKHRS